MDKSQAIHEFWSGFGLTAYDENTVPDDATMPYITYSMATGALDDQLSLSASLWYRSPSWEAISKKADEISDFITRGGRLTEIDGGYMYIFRDSPFSQRGNDPEDRLIRRMYIRISAEFFTAN